MAYVNVAEWKTDQVCEWLKGLENSVLPYVHSFMNHGVSGQQLLSLRPEDLEHLGVLKLGHQEIILQAVEYLRNFHYELDRENLQLLALRLSCQAHSLHNELSRQTDSKPVTTQTLSDVASVIMAVKPLIRWLDRPPFSGQLEYNDKKAELMELSLEMATCAQRDRFAEKPIEKIRTICDQLAKLADYIIQDIADPMILQPASLDLATLKKRPGDDLGFSILPSFHGAHQIAEIKFGSVAHQCGKMEEGDEIVQVNYQTIVGWERENVLELFSESPAEILLTLKRRPRHTKIYGQIYIKPYRLPSNKKTSYTTRWQHNLPSPRPELLTIPDFTMPLPRHIPKNPSPEPTSILDTMATDSSDSDTEVEPPLSLKPRNLVQRRATITGASPTTKHGIDIEQFWKELKQEHKTTFQLRDKAASCAHGLDNVPSNLRPQTCLGIEQTKKRKKADGQITDKKVQFQEKTSESETLQIDECRKPVNKTKEEVKSAQNPQEDLTINNEDSFNQVLQTTTNIINSNNLIDITVPLDECNNFINDRSNISKSAPNGKECNVRNIKERGKLDKSYSTSAFEFTDIGDRDERKLMLFENPLRKLDLPPYCLGNTPSNNSTKTDVHSFTESFDDTKCLKIDMIKQEESDDSCIITNVTPINSSNEKYTQCNDTEDQECVFRVPEQLELAKTSVDIKINDVNDRNSIEENQSNNEYTTLDLKICNVSHTVDDTEFENITKDLSFDDLADNCELNHESSEDKSESTSSYIEGTCSSSSEGDTSLKKFGKILQNIDCVLAENTKLIEKKVSAISIKENNAELNEPTLNDTSISTEDNLQNIVHNIPKIKINSNIINNDAKDTVSDFQEPVVHSYRHTEVPKVESVKKIETKSHLTPPEPPPRKYYTRVEAINVNVGSTLRMFENQEKHKVSETCGIKKDFKKCEFSSDTLIKRNVEYQEKNDNFDICSNFVEKIDFIDGSNTLNNEQKPITDTLTYSEINDKLLREEKSVCEKYEPFLEKFGSGSNQPTAEYYKPEQHFRNVDSPDGLTYSKQMQLADTKPKMTEKDKCFEKGVVNKAMMVARSIGLHGSLSKSSSNSPRSSRKRNMLLAKKRNVSVKDVGVGDLEGWLTYRSRGAGGAWARAWFVLKCSSLYRFKTQESIKADCLIALTGFTVSQAAEVKSRKYAFKVYHTGTVFYFAADTEDYLIVWLDAINKATLGADTYNRNSGLFSETDESDGEHKNKNRNSQTQEYKANIEKSFGSLRKVTRKDSGYKDHDIGGASLDRKYLRFLGARNQNVPVPTAQFRSYRRVLPTSTPNKKQDSNSNSPDLQMTIAGSTFYGLSASQSTTDMTNNSQDMGDYRRTTDRYFSSRSSRRSDDLQGFITLEEFMLSQQDEEDQRQTAINRSISPRIIPLINDHIHVQHRNFNDSNISNEPIKYVNDTPFKNGIVCTQAKNSNEIASNNSLYGTERNAESVHVSRQLSVDFNINKNETTGEYTSEKYCGKCKNSGHKMSLEFNCMHKRRTQDSILPQTKQTDLNYRKSTTNEQRQSSSLSHSKSDIIRSHNKQGGMIYDQHLHAYTQGIQSVNNYETSKSHDYFTSKDVTNLSHEVKSTNKRLTKNDGYSGSSGNLISHVSSETLQRAKKDVSVSRKGSFNLTNRRDHSSSDKHWLDSLRRDRKSVNCDKNRLKNVAQYQPPPIPSVPFEQERMRAAFEMHLDKNEQVQKANRLKSLFGTKCYQKPCTLDLTKDTQKTLLGSPRLHRALFRDKSNQSQRFSTRSGSQSPGDSGISQSLSSFSGNSPSQTLSQSFSSTSSVSDWSPDTPTPNVSKCAASHPTCQKGFANSNRNTCTPPILPYVPPPTSPPPDYPGLEYPPVFEPGTYSLSDASLLRNRNKNNQSIPQ